MQKAYQRNRKTTTSRHKTLITLLIAIGLMLLCTLVVLGIRIKDITVTGNNRYTDEKIVDMLFDGKWDYNFAYCYYKEKMKEHENIPFIQDYKIIFQGFTKLEIIIYEKSMVGCVEYMGSYMYFDKDGIIVDSSNERIEGIPLIRGLSFKQVVLYQPLPVGKEKIFTDILNLTQMLKSNEIEADKIYFDSDLNITLHIESVKVYLGDSSNLNGKILKLREIGPKLNGLSGTLYLDTYSENSDKPYSLR